MWHLFYAATFFMRSPFYYVIFLMWWFLIAIIFLMRSSFGSSHRFEERISIWWGHFLCSSHFFLRGNLLGVVVFFMWSFLMAVIFLTRSSFGCSLLFDEVICLMKSSVCFDKVIFYSSHLLEQVIFLNWSSFWCSHLFHEVTIFNAVIFLMRLFLSSNYWDEVIFLISSSMLLKS